MLSLYEEKLAQCENFVNYEVKFGSPHKMESLTSIVNIPIGKTGVTPTVALIASSTMLYSLVHYEDTGNILRLRRHQAHFLKELHIFATVDKVINFMDDIQTKEFIENINNIKSYNAEEKNSPLVKKADKLLEQVSFHKTETLSFAQSLLVDRTTKIYDSIKKNPDSFDVDLWARATSSLSFILEFKELNRFSDKLGISTKKQTSPYGSPDIPIKESYIKEEDIYFNKPINYEIIGCKKNNYSMGSQYVEFEDYWGDIIFPMEKEKEWTQKIANEKNLKPTSRHK